MAQSTTDLWPPIDQTETVRTPAAILKEAAAPLAVKTNNYVEAIVRQERTPDGRSFRHSVVLVAPILNGYAYDLLQVYHGIELWPVSVQSGILSPPSGILSPANRTAKDEEELKTVLSEVFQSPKTVRLIQSMIAQSKQ